MKLNNELKSFAAFLKSYFLLVVFAVIAFVFYHFVVIPLFVDYGIYGVLLTIALLSLAFWLIPKGDKMYTCVTFVGYLLFVRGMYQVSYKSIWEQLLAFVCLSLVLYLALLILTKKAQFTHVIVITVVGGLLFATFEQEELFFAKQFQVIYESPRLFIDENVDYFPLQLVDVNNDGKKEIITQGLTSAELLDSEIAKTILLPGRHALQLEPSRYLVFQHDNTQQNNKKWSNDNMFNEVGNSEHYLDGIWQNITHDYVGFPYYRTYWTNTDKLIKDYKELTTELKASGRLLLDDYFRMENDDLERRTFLRNNNLQVNTSGEAGAYEILVPQVDRLGLVQTFLPFGRTPFAALDTSIAANAAQQNSWQLATGDRLTNELIIGEAYLTSESLKQSVAHPEVVIYGEALEVYQRNFDGQELKLVAKLTPELLPEVADGEFILADVTGNGVSELLMSARPSQILRLVARDEQQLASAQDGLLYDWQQLWVAQDEVFRFEEVTEQGEIIAGAQSYKRDEARRYLTAYKFDEAQAKLTPLWRTKNTVINVRTGDVTGDGKHELVATYFREHKFVVLSPHGLPIQEASVILSLLGIMLIFGYRIRVQAFTKRDYYVSAVLFVFLFVALWGVTDNSHYSAEAGKPIISMDRNQTVNLKDNSEKDATSVEFSAHEWKNYWENAVNYTDDNAERFWYSGWVTTKLQKRQTNSMYDGLVVRSNSDSESNGILVNARILGKPFRYYESGEHVYLSEDGIWQRLKNEAGYPVDWLAAYNDSNSRLSLAAPFAEMLVLSDDAIAPKIIGEQRILGIDCDMIEFTVNTSSASMEWTVWVGQEEPYIMQYNVHTLMPVAGAGLMQQTTYFRFWRYNEDNIQLNDPEAIERQIKARELLQIEDIEKSLSDDDLLAELSSQELELLELRLQILNDNTN